MWQRNRFAVDVIRVGEEDMETNLADGFTKAQPAPHQKQLFTWVACWLVGPLMHWIVDWRARGSSLRALRANILGSHNDHDWTTRSEEVRIQAFQ
jgi:hypothetical protein